MLLYPKPVLRLTEADVADLADVPSPSSSPAPTQKASRTHAFFSVSTSPPPKPTKLRTDSFFNPQPAAPTSPPSPVAVKTVESSPKSPSKEPWWTKLRRKRDEQLPPSPIYTTSPLSEGFTLALPSSTQPAVGTQPNTALPSPSLEIPRHSPIVPTSVTPATPAKKLIPGEILSSSEAELALIRPLGEGSFSKVWLARDISSVPLAVLAKQRTRELRKRKSSLWGSTAAPEHTNTNPDQHLTPEAREVNVMRRNSSKRRAEYLTLGLPKDSVNGVRPSRPGDHGEAARLVSIFLDGYCPAAVSRTSSTSSSYSQRPKERLVALKLVERNALETSSTHGIMTREERDKDRAKVSFVREVEILKHISHPNIAPLLAQLTTESYHVLVLPYIPGGDLFALIKNDNAWNKLRESVLQRIFTDLVNAVGWMHSVGLVHRDIKLENILFVSTAFQDLAPDAPEPTLDSVLAASSNSHHAHIPSSSSANSVYLSTPPLIKLTDFGLSRFISPSSPLLRTRCGSEAYAAPELVTSGSHGYDARETDSWACGVCLYELACRTLPFGSDEESHLNHRKWLFRIALGKYSWPEVNKEVQEGQERIGATLSTSPDIRRVVSKLLVRDPKQRVAVGDLWDDPWILSEDDRVANRSSISTDDQGHLDQEMTKISICPSAPETLPEDSCVYDHLDVGETEEWVVDVPEKDSIARQELV